MVLHWDLSMSSGEDARCRTKMKPIIKNILPLTYFSKEELLSVLFMHYKLSKKRPLGRTEFRDVMDKLFSIGKKDIIERIFSAVDEINTKGIQPEAWAILLSIFCRGTLEEKIKLCFSVYDTMNVGYITRYNIVKMLKPTIVSRHPTDTENEDSIVDLVDVLMRKMDPDRDGKVSFGEYKAAVMQNPSLLEAFGQCLPNRNALYTLMTTFTDFVSTMHHNLTAERVMRRTSYDEAVHMRKKSSPVDKRLL